MKTILFVVLSILIGNFGQVVAQNFTFNAKGSFKIQNSEGTTQSYFYLNTQNGNVGQDTQAWQMMAQESAQAMVFSLVEYGKQMTQYLQIEGKKYVQTMTLSRENYTSQDFWKAFKKTGSKQTFGKYKAQEYTGKVDGKTLSIWLGEKTYNLDGKLQGDMLGLYGVGYLYHPNENVYYLLVHFKDADGEVTLLDITPFNYSFDGKGYEKMPEINMVPNTELNPNNPNNPNETEIPNSQIYTQEYNIKYSSIIGQILMGFEQSLPSLKALQNNPDIPAEQKKDMQKQIICIEKSIPIYKKAITEMKKAEAQFPNNAIKLQEEYTRISEEIDKQKASFCD